MRRKSDSLSFPSDPLATMRDLQDLNTETPRARRPTEPRKTPARAGSPDGGPAHPPPRRARRAGGPQEREEGADGQATPGPPADPMGEAVRALLEKPYTADPRTGPFTVSTVKIPTEVWVRLGWVAKLTGRTKQELIAEALKEHFRRAVRAG